MSITLGIYDVFSYAIPGFIYLFSFHEVFRIFSQPLITMTDMKEAGLGYFVLLGLASYVTGHLFDTISHRAWYRRFYRKGHAINQAYARFENTPGVKADFNVDQWAILFSVIRKNDREVADIIDKNKATAIMLRNVSFALILLALVWVVALFVNGWTNSIAIGVGAAFIGSIVAVRRSDKFNNGFYSVIFEQVLLYGNNLSEVLHNAKIRAEKSSENSTRVRDKRKAEND